jgi:hypothetical protein
VDAQLCADAFFLIELPCWVAGPIVAQLTSPLYCGGLGLHHLSAIKTHAALHFALALPLPTMLPGLEAVCSFSSAWRPVYAIELSTVQFLRPPFKASSESTQPSATLLSGCDN